MPLSAVLQQMKKLDFFKNPVPFSVSVRSFDKKNEKGGKLLTFENVTLLQQAKTPKKKETTKNPNHWKNRTRNIKLPNGEIKKINILFIIRFNGCKVVY